MISPLPAPPVAAAEASATWDWGAIVFVIAFAAMLVIPITGAVYGVRLAYRQKRLSEQAPPRFAGLPEDEPVPADRLDRLAETLGFTRIETVPPEVEAALGTAEITHAMRRRTRRGVYVLCDVREVARERFQFQIRGRGGYSRTIYCRTALLFLAAGRERFPAFVVAPKPEWVGLLLKWFAPFARGRTLRPFAEDPEFSDRVVVLTGEPEAVRPLMTPTVRAVLKENADLITRADGRAVAALGGVEANDWGLRSIPGRRFPAIAGVRSHALAAEDRAAFVRSALEIVKVLRRAAAESGKGPAEGAEPA